METVSIATIASSIHAVFQQPSIISHPTLPSTWDCLEKIVWPEVESALENGARTALVAVGSNERHGPHPPLKMDTLDGDELSRRIATELGDALAAPTIRPGCSGHHMEFPGTITAPSETLMDVIRSYCRSLDGHGFEHIARELDATVIALADLDEHMQLLNEGLSEAGIEYNQDVIHAGAAEMAMVLAIDEGLVRTENVESGPEGKVSAARLLSEGFKTITENGVLGDPTKATTDAGEVIIQNVVETCVKHIKTERDAL